MVRKILLAALAAALVFLPVAHADAATATVTTVGFTYVPPAVPVQQGDSLDYTNQDVVPHNVASDTPGLFSSSIIGRGATARVNGIENLAPGQYMFHCDLHAFMHGVLNVAAPAPTPAPPPIPAPPPAPG